MSRAHRSGVQLYPVSDFTLVLVIFNSSNIFNISCFFWAFSCLFHGSVSKSHQANYHAKCICRNISVECGSSNSRLAINAKYLWDHLVPGHQNMNLICKLLKKAPQHNSAAFAQEKPIDALFVRKQILEDCLSVISGYISRMIIVSVNIQGVAFL